MEWGYHEYHIFRQIQIHTHKYDWQKDPNWCLQSWWRNSWPLPFLSKHAVRGDVCSSPPAWNLQVSSLILILRTLPFTLHLHLAIQLLFHSHFHSIQNFKQDSLIWTPRNKHKHQKSPELQHTPTDLAESSARLSSMQDMHSGSPQSRQQPQDPPHSCSMMS